MQIEKPGSDFNVERKADSGSAALLIKGSFVNPKIKVTLLRSYIGRPEAQRKILAGMGLRKLNRSVLLQDTPEIRGMVRKVSHLVSMEEVKGKDT